MFSAFNPELQLFVGLLLVNYLLPVICHFFRFRFGLGPLFAAMGALTFLFWQMRLLGWWLVQDGWVFNVAHVAFIPALMSALVFCYAFDGIRAARSCWLILMLTSVLSIGFATFHHQLTLFSPVPSMFNLPLSSHYAVLAAVFMASTFTLLCYELLCRLNDVFALVFSICLSAFVFLFMQSCLEYGIDSGLTNFVNHIPEFLICLLLSGFLTGVYGLFCHSKQFFLAPRPMLNILLFWHKAESNLSSDDMLEAGYIMSESRQLNQQLSETQRLHDYHVRHSSFAIVHTREDGLILSGNTAAEALFNLSADDLVNSSIYNFLSLMSLNDLAEGQVDTVVEFVDADKHIFWHQYTALPVYDALNKCFEYQVLIKDVTLAQRARITQNIERNVRNIHRTSKMLSHDISNLLLGIEGSIYQTKQAFGLADKTLFNTCYETILTALNQGRTLLSQLSGGQPLGAPRLGPCHLLGLIDDAVKIAKASADSKHIEFVVCHSLNPLLRVDSSQIVRVFTNLLINAVRASGENSLVSVGLNPDKNGFAIHFIDQGEGMSKSQIEHAFDPAFSTKGNGQGGLGLAISYLIIDAHGGYLVLSNNSPDSGMTATVWLPDISDIIDSSLTDLRLLLACSGDGPVSHFAHKLDASGMDWVESQNSDELAVMLEENWDILLVWSDFIEAYPISSLSIPCIVAFSDDFSMKVLKDDNELTGKFLDLF